jgi:hypothetical protein
MSGYEPTDLTATAIDGGNVNLSWTAPTSSPSDLNYYIQYKIGGFGDWILIATITFPTTTYSVTNLNKYPSVNNSTIYCFRVYVVNTVGSISTNYYSNIAEAMPFNNSLPTHLWSRFTPYCDPSANNINNINPLNDEGTSAYDMQRKAQVLQYPVTGRLNFTKAQLWSMAAKNKLTRKKAWASQNQEISYPNTTNANNYQGVGLKQVNNTLTCRNNPPTKICNSSTASNVPGKPMTLCLTLGAPFNNYRNPKTFASGGTKWPVYFSKNGEIYVPT